MGIEALGIDSYEVQAAGDDCGKKVSLCERHASIAMNNCMAGALNALADEAGSCANGSYSVTFGGHLSIKGKKIGGGNVNLTAVR